MKRFVFNCFSAEGFDSFGLLIDKATEPEARQEATVAVEEYNAQGQAVVLGNILAIHELGSDGRIIRTVKLAEE
jgi:hypothetical protein